MQVGTGRSGPQLPFQLRSKPKPLGCASKIAVTVFQPKQKKKFGKSFIAWCARDRRKTKSRRDLVCPTCVKLSNNTAAALLWKVKKVAARSLASLCRDYEKPEVRSQKSEVRSQRSEIRGHSTTLNSDF